VVVQSAQGLSYIIFLGGEGWVGELCMVYDARLSLLQFHTGSFGASWQGEMASMFSVLLGIRRLSMG
jgi:hypothetical protein